MSTRLPSRADVVVIGGGVIGLSTAYNLARSGAGSVLLLDQGSFGAGSTCKAAGGVRASFSDEANIVMGNYGLDVFERFDELFDQEIDLVQNGYLFLLDDPADVADFERSVALQQSLGVDARMIDPAEAKRLAPIISTDGVLAAAYAPRDGHCTPESVVLGYARAARRAGATLVPNCRVTGGVVVDGTIRAVETEAGTVETGTVVCCAGAWSRTVGEWFGVDLPVDPVRRQIVVTEPIADLNRTMPMTIDFSTTFYFHEEGPGMLVGMSDRNETPGFKLSRGDEWLPGLAEAIERRAPSLGEVGIASGWAGLYEVTPDHNGLIGEAPDVSRFLYATGFSGHGFLLGPAMGEVMCSLWRGEAPFVDVSAFDARRFEHAVLHHEKNIV
ncbi:sarcosine oxidase subunit beta [Intrasporangium chromatireducens Q5-1]|uniref:Sarcosine oxidase subunit beta n=1 Tax=Intrasporangium chromatireducens Q5-1 TaxID=584657 RepID=W9GTB3_9MICO|nr:FAD-binding oxidoreductase [Intrasporangium chromatireducens]EWT07119.1 sarcosine oxidase subunit beta [Intrasporangium chromatireducens Q5-1]